jgi:hypothetical protein
MVTRMTRVSRQGAKFAKKEPELSIQYFMVILKTKLFPFALLATLNEMNVTPRRQERQSHGNSREMILSRLFWSLCQVNLCVLCVFA